MTKFRSDGVWWLPSDPRTKIPGTLSCERGSFPTLTLAGSFLPIDQLQRGVEIPIVLGHANAKPITISNCLVKTASFSFPEATTCELYAAAAFVGAHFATTDDITFGSVGFCWDGLNSLFGRSGFRREMGTGADGRAFSRLTLEYRHPEAVEVGLPDATLRFVPGLRVSQKSSFDHELSQSTVLTVVPTSKLRLEDYLLNYVGPFSALLTLGIGHQVSLTAIRGNPSSADRVEVLIHVEEDSEVFAERQHDLLFNFDTLPGGAAEALARWFARASSLRPVLNLYVSTLQTSKYFQETRFLALSQALETYHRRTDDGVLLPESDASQLVTELQEVIAAKKFPSDIRRALEGKLTYLNELTLRRRVIRVLRRLGMYESEFFGDPSSFASSVVDLRNYLTHYDPSLASRVPSPDGMSVLLAQLRALLEFCLLFELGFDLNAIAALAGDHPRYTWLMSAACS